MLPIGDFQPGCRVQNNRERSIQTAAFARLFAGRDAACGVPRTLVSGPPPPQAAARAAHRAVNDGIDSATAAASGGKPLPEGGVWGGVRNCKRGQRPRGFSSREHSNRERSIQTAVSARLNPCLRRGFRGGSELQTRPGAAKIQHSGAQRTRKIHPDRGICKTLVNPASWAGGPPPPKAAARAGPRPAIDSVIFANKSHFQVELLRLFNRTFYTVAIALRRNSARLNCLVL